jgi:AcrR family transcriptional regulator
MKIVTRPRKVPARQRIRTAAVELMGRKGVAGTTTQDIARRARCSQAAIYKYWDSKERLAREEFDQAHTRLIEAMEARAAAGPTPGARVLGALSGLLGFAREFPAEYAFLFQVFHSDYARWLAPHKMPRDVILTRIESAMGQGEVSPGDAHTKAALLLGMAVRLAFFERQKLLPGGPEQIDEALWDAGAAVLEG